MHNITEFAKEMRKVAEECMRVLRPGSTVLFSWEIHGGTSISCRSHRGC
ncbi:MAG: hypothetical protein OIN88_13800 [Candidatus Methanoperedens sp.]|nr:hypothetical protein [Candidatus Methanoperedens sp.]